jgi:hypothetical protein
MANGRVFPGCFALCVELALVADRKTDIIPGEEWT